MRIKFCALLLLMFAVACTTAPTATPVPPTKATVQSSSSVASVASSSSVASNVTGATASCTTTNAAPPDKFRADDPAKFAAVTGKPKLVEFFAYW